MKAAAGHVADDLFQQPQRSVKCCSLGSSWFSDLILRLKGGYLGDERWDIKAVARYYASLATWLSTWIHLVSLGEATPQLMTWPMQNCPVNNILPCYSL